MNTFFPFFPALVRLISALLSFLNAFMITINALLDIVSVDRYKLPLALFWRLQAHSCLGQHCCSYSGRTGKQAL